MNGQTKKIIGITVVALIAIAAGVCIGVAFSSWEGKTQKSNDTFQAGWDAAKKRFADSGFMSATPFNVMRVDGRVIAMRSGGMTIQIRPLEPLADPALDTRDVQFNADTKFYQMVQKNSAVYQKEMEEFSRKMQALTGKSPVSPTDFGTPPEPFEQKEILASDIKQDNQVVVTAAQNIKDAKEFVATTIIVQTISGGAIPVPTPAIP